MSRVRCPECKGRLEKYKAPDFPDVVTCLACGKRAAAVVTRRDVSMTLLLSTYAGVREAKRRRVLEMTDA